MVLSLRGAQLGQIGLPQDFVGRNFADQELLPFFKDSEGANYVKI